MAQTATMDSRRKSMMMDDYYCLAFRMIMITKENIVDDNNYDHLWSSLNYVLN